MPPIQANIPITPGTGLFLDAVGVVIGPNTVLREITVLGDPSNATQLATVNAGGALNVSDTILEACITANVLAVSLPTAQISTLTPPSASAIAAAIVANPPTVGITGSVSVTQGTSPWVVSLSSTTITGNIAATIADGADVTLGAKADAKSTATDTTAISIMSVLKEISFMEQNPASQAVTNIGTFAVQATLSTETTKVIGTVNISAAQKIEIYDGTNTAAVKAASTPAVATDPALVVAVSPNNSITTTPGAAVTSVYSKAVISTTSTTAVLIAGVNGQTIRVYRIFFQNAGATVTAITIEDTTPTAFSGAFNLVPNGTFNGDGDGDPLYTTAAGKGFQVLNSAGMQLSGTVWYTQS